MSWCQKGKTSLDFTEARDSKWQRHQLGHMQVCTLLQIDNHASTPPLCFYRPDALPATQPTASKLWMQNHSVKSPLIDFLEIDTVCGRPSVLWRCWFGGRKGIRPVKKLSGEVLAWLVICLEWGADLHMPSWCHCHSLSLAPVKSRLVLPIWYRLTRVVPDKGPLNGCLVGCWRGYLSGSRCRLAYGPADATATHCLLLQ